MAILPDKTFMEALLELKIVYSLHYPHHTGVKKYEAEFLILTSPQKVELDRRT